MKTNLSLFLFAILLVSCTPAPTIAATAPEVLLPAETSTPEQTATEMATITPSVPVYMQEYLERGYDSLSGNGSLYLVIDETRVHYAPEAGIIYHARVIRDWFDVAYFENGVFKRGIVLDFVGGDIPGQQSNFKFIDTSAIQRGPFIPTLAFTRSMRQTIIGRTNGDYPIAAGNIGLTGTDPDMTLLYGDIFPAGATSVNIPGIGEVLAITQLNYVDTLATPTPKP